MAVPGDYDPESRSLRLQIKQRQIMQHVNRNAANLDNLRLRQFAGPRLLVDIPAHSGHWRDPGKFIENLRRANVPRMNDVH